MSNNKIEPICKNCGLYNKKDGICQVAIISEGKKVYLRTDPEERCFFESTVDTKDGGVFIPSEEIQQIKMWVENPRTGKQTDENGIVKIEYPENLFHKQ